MSCKEPRGGGWLKVHVGNDQKEGPESTIEGRLDYLVIHVSWNDTMAYFKREDKRLPIEAEREFAACGGLEQKNTQGAIC